MQNPKKPLDELDIPIGPLHVMITFINKEIYKAKTAKKLEKLISKKLCFEKK